MNNKQLLKSAGLEGKEVTKIDLEEERYILFYKEDVLKALKKLHKEKEEMEEELDQLKSNLQDAVLKEVKKFEQQLKKLRGKG